MNKDLIKLANEAILLQGILEKAQELLDNLQGTTFYKQEVKNLCGTFHKALAKQIKRFYEANVKTEEGQAKYIQFAQDLELAYKAI